MSLGTLAVAHDPSSAALVRRSIAADLADRHITGDCIDDVVLVASELVGNAILHTESGLADELDVTWDVEPDSVVVNVIDASREQPRRRTVDEDDMHGRGLNIVAALARDWGVHRIPRGKRVWARVPVSHD